MVVHECKGLLRNIILENWTHTIVNIRRPDRTVSPVQPEPNLSVGRVSDDEMRENAIIADAKLRGPNYAYNTGYN